MQGDGPMTSARETVESEVEQYTAAEPAVIWLELTSCCPFDCIFCSRRQVRRGGQHLEFELLESILGELRHLDVVRLNYAGESAHYPQLLDAIRMARGTGATIELVSSLASMETRVLEGLPDAGLDRLTVSLHTLDPVQFRQIYGYGSLERLQEAVDLLIRIKRARNSDSPEIDFAFVAMSCNLTELPSVASYAAQVGAASLLIYPVIARDLLPGRFEREIESGRLRPSFALVLRHAVEEARRISNIEIRLSGADASAAGRPPLPDPQKRLVWCEQNPWETTHILADGSVVACEVLERNPMGNLNYAAAREDFF